METQLQFSFSVGFSLAASYLEPRGLVGRVNDLVECYDLVQDWSVSINFSSWLRAYKSDKTHFMREFQVLWSECFPLKFMCLTLTPKMMVIEGGVFASYLGHEGRVLINEIIVKESPERSLASSIWGYNKKLLTKPGRGPLPKHDHADTFVLGFPASRTVKKKYLLFVSHPGHGTLSEQPKGSSH